MGLLRTGEPGLANALMWPHTERRVYCLTLLGSLLIAGTALVYYTGGTAYSYPYLMLIPVLVASAWYGLAGGLLSALLASVLMAWMPLDVDQSLVQTPVNRVVRAGLYMLLGAVAGSLFQCLRRAYREREDLVRTDPRSGLLNQVALEQDLGRSFEAERRALMGLIIVRLSDIGEVLEVMGAYASDELSGLLGARLQKLVGDNGKVYRFSVSELAVVTFDTEQARLESMVGRIIDAGEDNLLVQTVPVRVQLALGYTVKEARNTSVNELINEARIALFNALRQGRNHCAFSPELSRKNLSNITLISNVRKGLDRREFELHYQPKVRLSDGALVGSEALIRWYDSKRQPIPPSKFMPRLEETTLITPVTEFVSREACEFQARNGAPVSINFSARNLVNEDVLTFLGQEVKRLGLAPGSIEVEVTESALIQNLDAAREAIKRLREMDFEVSIDDFGTGFASFEYLQHLPITGIKIDRAFVQYIESHERSRRLTASMVNMGHALELKVTAEGVETLAQYQLLREMGCDQAQGFLFTPALPPSRYAVWCDSYRPIVSN